MNKTSTSQEIVEFIIKIYCVLSTVLESILEMGSKNLWLCQEMFGIILLCVIDYGKYFKISIV